MTRSVSVRANVEESKIEEVNERGSLCIVTMKIGEVETKISW